MELQRPFRVVTPTVDGDVLAVLAGADAEFTPPQVHRLIGDWSVEGVRKALDRLAAQGIVTHRVAGRAGLYRLNRQHLAAAAIQAIAGQRDELLVRLKGQLTAWRPRPEYAALFGSAATGGMSVESDVDLFIVRPDEVDPDSPPWRDQIDSLERVVTAWTGNDARVLEYTASECVAGVREGDAVLADIAREGIRVIGTASLLNRVKGGRRGEGNS
jgi:predicted nucleotidyltransferase